MTEQTALYRHFDSEGKLLYVGISNDPCRRLSEHEKTKDWKSEIRDIKIEYFETREIALLAEQLAIKVEKPLHNVVFNAAMNPKSELIGCAKQGLRSLTEEEENSEDQLHSLIKFWKGTCQPGESLDVDGFISRQLFAYSLTESVLMITCSDFLPDKDINRWTGLKDRILCHSYGFGSFGNIGHSVNEYCLVKTTDEETYTKFKSEWERGNKTWQEVRFTEQNAEKYGWVFDRTMRNGLGGWNNKNRQKEIA